MDNESTDSIGGLTEDEKRQRREASEKRFRELQIDRSIQESRERTEAVEQTRERLTAMRDMMERGLITDTSGVESALNAIDSESVDPELIAHLCEKLEDMNTSDPDGVILPLSMRPTGEEYRRAFFDDELKSQMIWKLDTALRHVASQIPVVALMSPLGLMAVPQKVQVVQESLHDMRSGLHQS